MSGFTLRSLLRGVDEAQLHATYACWHAGDVPERRSDCVAAISRAMMSEEAVEARLKSLSKKLSDLLDVFLGEPGRARSVREVEVRTEAGWPSRFDAEAALAALQREGFLLPLQQSGERLDRKYALPSELAEGAFRLRHRHEEIHGTLTLKGFLNTRYFDQTQRNGDPDDRAQDHARKVYKIYLMESSIVGRVDSLPERVRRVWDVVLSRYGGLMPIEELEQVLGEDCPDLDFVKKSLEEAMLGTVAPMRMARFGIKPYAMAVVVFNEISLLCLPRHSAEHPVAVDEEARGGVDLVSNVGRLLREIGQSKVQFTVEGRLYKASERRIAKTLLPVRGGVMDEQQQIRFIYTFSLARRLLDRSGERALRPTDAGRDFDSQPLLDKVRTLLAYSVEERGMPGEDYHQVRLRRVVLRLLKRVEPDVWHELLFIPFLARNSYLSRLEELRVADFFSTRFKSGVYLPSENLQQLCWNLVQFIKRRLYPLGLVDLGMRGGRPIAVRLSRLGAELLGAVPAGEVGGDRSEVVVNPDFEIILFPGEDEHEVVHSFDRFATRVKSDRIHQFSLSRDSVQAAIKDGVGVAQVLQELKDRSRVPLPQNVVYSLEDWACQVDPNADVKRRAR